ncbi:MAG: PTS lactose/cellobiose transporter subunit IIA, partial [Selenomonadaceae bacterium]|nr:PTS lactose/cellobiose transporter subunit IIA [Selenomonadaceae bacterium]
GEAHQMQTDLISAECDGQEVEKSVLLIHAQDHFMTALAVRDMASLMVDMYEKLSQK